MKTKKPYKPTKHPRNTARIFKNLDDDADVIRSQFHFLQDVWDFWDDIGDPVYTFLAFKKVTTGKWVEQAIKASDGLSEVTLLLTKYPRWDYDQYYCPNPFSEPRRKRQYALPTRFGWCDMDESDPEEYDPWASLVWETSPDRYQGLWVWDKTHSAGEAEKFSKALAYRHGGDKNGWSATKMLRLIGSVNHKPEYDEPFVHTVYCDWTKIASRPMPLKGRRHSWPVSMAEVDANPNKHDRLAVLKKYWKELHPKVRTLIRNRKAYEPNRSAQIFHMIAGLHEAGASHDEIAAALWDSPYFFEKHGYDIGKLNDEIGRVVGRLGGGK
ncbi:hypothetical protein HPQ64_07720 [Rhizobiales bacterium]|uniref:DNA-primase RepB domain-containing protein n=1 Tax=Hongsoonwoonella zoysiae TaxID=2821844 RepID=UPI00155F6B06|nr:DNA-primase RepB domain-containing protein [Hongsoonwoonella zoysiae]NRG17573.1 hypothetical protein [Hongsoonwoonella zoysiae]